MQQQQAGRTLVADVGGTNTRCALAEAGVVLRQTERRFRNAEFAARGEGLGEVLAAYLREYGGADCASAAVAIAGPVRDGVGELTNINWRIDRRELARITGAHRAEVLNDLQAQGFALDSLQPGTVQTILPGRPVSGATRLVIGAGTGFNAAPVYETAAGRLVPPSEAGHASLPVRGEDGQRLRRFLEVEVATAHGFASIEEALAGRGLESIYRWLSSEAGAPAHVEGHRIMHGLESGSDRIAEAAVRIYVRTLGTVAGDLALTVLPYGGVFLIGGMARAVAPWLARFGFAEAFCDKGRFGGFMAQFAVHVVSDDYAALTGCAVHLHATRGR